jgi:hypothetical protein
VTSGLHGPGADYCRHARLQVLHVVSGLLMGIQLNGNWIFSTRRLRRERTPGWPAQIMLDSGLSDPEKNSE